MTYSNRESQSGAFNRNPAGSGAALDDGENVVIDGFFTPDRLPDRRHLV